MSKHKLPESSGGYMSVDRKKAYENNIDVIKDIKTESPPQFFDTVSEGIKRIKGHIKSEIEMVRRNSGDSNVGRAVLDALHWIDSEIDRYLGDEQLTFTAESVSAKDPYLDEEHLYNKYQMLKMANERNMKEKHELEAENRRLRAVLTYIDKESGNYADKTVAISLIESFKRRAREALK